jgi:hypothetical protein
MVGEAADVTKTAHIDEYEISGGEEPPMEGGNRDEYAGITSRDRRRA